MEDDPALRATVRTFLELEGYAPDEAGSTREALARLDTQAYGLVLTDIYLDEKTGLDVLHKARTRNPACKVILMSGRGSMETVMEATRGGAFDYLAKPFELDDLLDVLRRAETDGQPVEGDEEVDIDDLPETDMIGSSPKLVQIYKDVAKVAQTDATVLVEGETGTGKELIARMVHRFSLRAAAPFVPVDCGSIAPALLESELFGALKGSYTGADRDRTGVFETANGGTVFLDEIGDIDLSFQLKLLRFLQEREVRPVGASRARPVDVRVVAATNKDIPRLVEEGKFREDLWFRVNVIRILLPPLRARHGDVALLADHFLKKYNAKYRQRAVLLKSGVKALEDFTWPGNVRQLQHLMERLSILAPQGRIDEDAVADALDHLGPAESAGGDTLAETEAEQIRRVMQATNGNKSRAAKILGIERKTLYRKLERLELS